MSDVEVLRDSEPVFMFIEIKTGDKTIRVVNSRHDVQFMGHVFTAAVFDMTVDPQDDYSVLKPTPELHFPFAYLFPMVGIPLYAAAKIWVMAEDKVMDVYDGTIQLCPGE